MHFQKHFLIYLVEKWLYFSRTDKICMSDGHQCKTLRQTPTDHVLNDAEETGARN
jgi:hypothetical protein